MKIYRPGSRPLNTSQWYRRYVVPRISLGRSEIEQSLWKHITAMFDKFTIPIATTRTKPTIKTKTTTTLLRSTGEFGPVFFFYLFFMFFFATQISRRDHVARRAYYVVRVDGAATSGMKITRAQRNSFFFFVVIPPELDTWQPQPNSRHNRRPAGRRVADNGRLLRKCGRGKI